MSAITLGRLIALLKLEDQTHTVSFDFGGLIPRGIDSYRGFYDQLAVAYDDDWNKKVKVPDFVAILEAVNGKVLTGYKGGDFTMTLGTPVWAANYGECNSTAIVGLANCSWTTVLATEFCD